MQRILLVWLCLLCLPLTAAAAPAGEREADLTQEMLDAYTELYGDVFSQGLDALKDHSFRELIPDFQVQKLLKALVSGRLELSFPALFRALARYLLGEVYSSLKLMGMALALSVLSASLAGLQDGFGSEGTAQAAFWVCYMALAGVASAAFWDAAQCAVGAVENISAFMKMVVPVVVTTLLTSGAIVSASVFEPTLLAVVEISVTVIQTLLIPLVMMTAAMNIVNGLSQRFKIQRMVKLMNQCVKWGLSIMLTIFVSAAGLQSIAAAGADGLTVKLTKFAASNLIPVVGGILSESVETVMNCSLLIKNSVGALGIICLAVIAAAPLLKLAAILLIFRLTAALAEPIAEPRSVVCLSELANAVSVLFSMLAAVTVMFVLALTVMINAGNTAILLGR